MGHCLGLALMNFLVASGRRIHNVIAKAVRATTQEWLWPDALFRDHLPALVKEGFLAHSVFEDFLAEWEARSKEPDAIFFGSPMMEVIGRRS